MKQRVNITLDSETVTTIRDLDLKISEIAQEACDDIILAYCNDDKEKSRPELRMIQKAALKKFRERKSQEINDMRNHIRAAKEAGISRGQAETDFGRVFPDAIWNGE